VAVTLFNTTWHKAGVLVQLLEGPLDKIWDGKKTSKIQHDSLTTFDYDLEQINMTKI